MSAPARSGRYLPVVEGLEAAVVEGKGVAAAGLTETVRTAIQSYALIDPSPAACLRCFGSVSDA